MIERGSLWEHKTNGSPSMVTNIETGFSGRGSLRPFHSLITVEYLDEATAQRCGRTATFRLSEFRSFFRRIKEA